MQRPRCGYNVPEKSIGESVYCVHCEYECECRQYLQQQLSGESTQRPECPFELPERYMLVSYECAHCVKKDECRDWLQKKQQPLCAHCDQAKETKWQDSAGRWICNDCMTDLLNEEMAGICAEYKEGQPPIDAECPSKDPKSRYYDQGGIEVFDVIRAKLTPEQWRGYLLGNLIKYGCRANWKGDFERDAEKMKFYAGYLADEK